jgi:septal ring factor EnvC (AmiA/AmiB activator)
MVKGNKNTPDTTVQDISTVIKSFKIIGKYKEFIAIVVLIVASSGANLRLNFLSNEKESNQEQTLYKAQSQLLSEIKTLEGHIQQLENELVKAQKDNEVLIIEIKNMKETLNRVDRRSEMGIWGILKPKEE